MPTMPRAKATTAAMLSITSANDVCAIESDRISSSVRTLATGRFGLTDQTAACTSLSSAGDPTRGVRMA
jgi:hypothetical protein